MTCRTKTLQTLPLFLQPEGTLTDTNAAPFAVYIERVLSERIQEMNDDVLGGMWKQIKGNVKSTFGKLTDDDMTEIEGDSERLLGKLQERYGYSRAEAEKAWNDFRGNIDRDADRAEGEADDAIDEAKRGLRRALD